MGNPINFSDDLSNWMGNLPSDLRNIPLIHLAIPGSHDSMTYGITRKSGISPDAEPAIKKISLFCHSTIRRWAITQEYDITDQLNQGIRYIDFRIATKKPSTDLYFVHGLYAEEISNSLAKIRDFLDNHPGEIVIIDCQHFYAFSNTDHAILCSTLYETFTYRLCPNSGHIDHCSLNSLTNNREQIIIVYRGIRGHKYFWSSSCWSNPWPNQITIPGLISALKQSLQERLPNTGHVTQCLLTPSASFIALRWHSNLKKKCALPVALEIFPWISQLKPGRPNAKDLRVNVVMADFIEINESSFSKMVIDLNKKILDDTQFNV